MTSPAELYGEALRTRAPALLRYDDGRSVELDLPRWVAPACGADDDLLARCAGSTLDVGCGPGRLTRALAQRGLPCLGVDVSPVAVDLARVGGVPVLHASAFDAVLDDTRWDTVLLADGNVGIGGDPVALLHRCRALLAPGGRVLVEVDAPERPSGAVRVRVEGADGRTSRWFTWAHLSATDAATAAAQAELAVRELWCTDGRWFADLRGAP